MTEQPKYHCNRCGRSKITSPIESWRQHEEWKNQRRAKILVHVLAVAVVILAVMCVAGALAVYG